MGLKSLWMFNSCYRWFVLFMYWLDLQLDIISMIKKLLSYVFEILKTKESVYQNEMAKMASIVASSVDIQCKQNI